MFVSTKETDKIDVSGSAMCDNSHTMSSHKDTAIRDTDSYVYSYDVSRMSIKCVCIFEVMHFDILHVNF
jgi:hypothetical protein